ncbi:MAG: hypothetical protein IPH62_05040 [Ignavibacteriae bacterium]|nr:hypothetical protein [Ignavibacteriota bacterium]
MLYEKFIRLVEDHADSITKEWIKEVKSNPSTFGYRKVDDEILKKRIHNVYRRLGEWIMNADPTDANTAEFFIDIGRQRAAENLKSSEVIYALILSRVVLWRYIINHGIIHSSLELHQCLGFYQQLNNFFDKAAYYVAVGYESLHLADQEKMKQEKFVDKTVKGITNWFFKTKEIK